MKFEIFNDKGKIVFQCHQTSCLPTIAEVKSMATVGYKFKLDGKQITRKNLIEFIGEKQ